jgi:hypothetical protein
LVDPITLVIGAAVGAASGFSIAYLTYYAKPRQQKLKTLQRDEFGQVRVKSVGMDELEHSKREMRTLMLERDLLSSALTKIYEAETQGKITREEREMIARRYSEQIKEIDGKLRDKELIVEVGELESLRDELLSLFREKIENIELRLGRSKEKLQSLRPEVKVEAAKKEPPVEELETVIERKASRKEESEGERRVRELREEVMEALARLEQIDVKKENEST